MPGGAFLLDHAFDQVGDIGRGAARGGARRAAGDRSEGDAFAAGGEGETFNEHGSKELGEDERVDYAALLNGKNLLKGGFVRGGLVAQGGFQTRGLRRLSAGAAKTDLPAQPGNVVVIARPVFFRQLEGGFYQMRRPRPGNGALVRKNLQRAGGLPLLTWK